MRLSPFLLLPPLLLLGACGQDSTPEQDGRSASGEVLEGTISDAMLPLATVRSQPPLLDPEAAEQARARPSGLGGSSAAPVMESGESETQPEGGSAGEAPGTPAPPPPAPVAGAEAGE